MLHNKLPIIIAKAVIDGDDGVLVLAILLLAVRRHDGSVYVLVVDVEILHISLLVRIRRDIIGLGSSIYYRMAYITLHERM